MLYWNSFRNYPWQPLAESSYATDSTDSSFSSATSTTSTGTVVCNFNALKPKNNQTHSVSQTSLQSTGITTAASTKPSPPSVDKSNKCQLLQCSYANLTPNTSQVDQPTSTAPQNHGTIEFCCKFERWKLAEMLCCHNRGILLLQGWNIIEPTSKHYCGNKTNFQRPTSSQNYLLVFGFKILMLWLFEEEKNQDW